MLVTRCEMTDGERFAFEAAVRACGRDPGEFRVEVFTAAGAGRLRSVHVSGGGAAAQYAASGGRTWTACFAEHLAGGRFP